MVGVLLLLPLATVAQQPSHYTLGKQELEGVDIYDVLHTKQGNYLVASSNGLLQFDGYRFRQVGCPDMLMTSVYNLVEDHEGHVYCHNLSGQVFKVGNGQCEVYVTLADSLASADIDLAIDNRNKLVISSNRLMVVDENRQPKVLSGRGYYSTMTRLPDSTVRVFSSVDKQYLQLKDGVLKRKRMTLPPIIDKAVFSTIVFRESTYEYRSNSCEIYRNGSTVAVFDPLTVVPKKQVFRLYATSNAFWLATNSVGVMRLDEHFRPTNGGGMLFANTMISCVKEDAEGNVLLGTFGKGIIVIPNESTEDLSLPLVNDEVISIAGHTNGSLYFGTRTGQLFERNGKQDLRLIRDARVKSMEALFAIDTDKLLIGEFDGMLIDLANGTEMRFSVGSLKDVCVKGGGEWLMATNSGAYLLELPSKRTTRIAELQLRHHCIGFDATTGSIYSGTSKGLLIRKANGTVSPFTLQGNQVMAQDVFVQDALVFVATAKHGVLVFKNDKLLAQWNTSTGLAADQVSHIAEWNGLLVIATAKGIQLLTTDGAIRHTIHHADGLNTTKTLDMEVMGDALWVVHSLGVQQVMLNTLLPNAYVPELVLQRIVVNDSVNVPLSQHDFRADQQKWTFELQVNSLRYREEITYRYRLEGAETEWHESAFINNVIDYRSLSPGTYTFRAKAVCRGMESEEVAYTFTIATPFYKAWWFYLVLLVGMVLTLIFWFKRRLKRQQLLAEQQNELNASKLTAIRSQMNPHFIFNALNSIQSLVLKGDVDNSYTYITKFANLVRRTLNYSDKEFIDFSEEIKLIELYLTLEQLRFKEDFEFTITTADIEDVMMPPMLIQPFIENALVHGLLHRQGPKRIRLDFELKDVLICTITDNGVGRERAKAIKERQRSEHESFSVNAIRTRFELLERYYDGKLGFEYEDLMENGEAAGTRVRLRIPVKRKF